MIVYQKIHKYVEYKFYFYFFLNRFYKNKLKSYIIFKIKLN